MTIDKNLLAEKAGIHFMYPTSVARPSAAQLAQDAQSVVVSGPNAGIPAWLANYFDPKVIDFLVTPMKAAEIVGESKKGDWVTKTITFLTSETTGQAVSYGDYNNGGQANANQTFPQRQSYHYQVHTQWGEQEIEIAALANIDLASRKNLASILILNKFQNKSYFYGISGLQNYGLLNDPSLPAAITPAVGSWNDAATTSEDVFEDVRLLFVQLQTQLNGNIEMDAKMTLALSPVVEVALAKTNQYGLTVVDRIKKVFPNMRFVNAVEYSTASGELVQLIADEIEGQRTAECVFTEKLRAHRIVVDTSSFKQKKSQGTWGTVIYRPMAIAQLLGV